MTANAPASVDCSSSCTASLDARSNVTLTAMPAAGSDFIGWTGACSGVGACTVTMDAAKAVTVRFSISRVVFHSARKIDGTDAPNANGTNNVWRVNDDGTGLTALTMLTANGAGSSFPTWSPDGSKIAFRSTRNLNGSDAPNMNMTINLWRINADGTSVMPLTTATAAGADAVEPQWSPDGTMVLFESGRRLDGSDAVSMTGTRNVWRVNADGNGLRLITNVTAAGTDCFGPRWSPDGTKVVFYSRRKIDGSDAPSPNAVFNIWRVNADATGLLALTTTTAVGTNSQNPQWSPDGNTIAFASSRRLDGSDASNPATNIWRVNADGTGLRLITNATAAGVNQIVPQWSPDGTKIVFYSTRKLDGSDAQSTNGIFNIWRVNPDGSGFTALTNSTLVGTGSFDPQWSPGGTKIVFWSTRKLDGTDAPNMNQTGNIWRVNTDGTGLTPITRAMAANANSELGSYSP